MKGIGLLRVFILSSLPALQFYWFIGVTITIHSLLQFRLVWIYLNQSWESCATERFKSIHLHVCVYVVCVCVYMCIYVYVYVYMHFLWITVNVTLKSKKSKIKKGVLLKQKISWRTGRQWSIWIVKNIWTLIWDTN